MSNNKLTPHILRLTITMLFLAGCRGGTNGPVTTSILGGTAWVLLSLNSESLIEDTRITLNFENEYLYGSTGCNGYGGGLDGGKYTATDQGALTVIPPMATTVQLCSEPEGIMEQEAAYIEALMSATNFRVVDNRLEIGNAAGGTTLVFTRQQ